MGSCSTMYVLATKYKTFISEFLKIMIDFYQCIGILRLKNICLLREYGPKSGIL